MSHKHIEPRFAKLCAAFSGDVVREQGAEPIKCGLPASNDAEPLAELTEEQLAASDRAYEALKQSAGLDSQRIERAIPSERKWSPQAYRFGDGSN